MSISNSQQKEVIIMDFPPMIRLQISQQMILLEDLRESIKHHLDDAYRKGFEDGKESALKQKSCPVPKRRKRNKTE